MKIFMKVVAVAFTVGVLLYANPVDAARHDASDMSETQLRSIAAHSVAGWWLIGPLFIDGVELQYDKVVRTISVEWVDDDGTFKVEVDSDNGKPTIMEGWRDWGDTLGYGDGHLCMYMTVPSGNVHTLLKAE